MGQMSIIVDILTYSTFLILLHGYTVPYHRVSLSPMPKFFFQIFVKEILDLLCFNPELRGLVALWSKHQTLIADCTCSQIFSPLLLYTIQFVSELTRFLFFWTCYVFLSSSSFLDARSVTVGIYIHYVSL